MAQVWGLGVSIGIENIFGAGLGVCMCVVCVMQGVVEDVVGVVMLWHKVSITVIIGAGSICAGFAVTAAAVKDCVYCHRGRETHCMAGKCLRCPVC